MMSDVNNIRVLVVDDNAMMRRGLSETISVVPGLSTVGSASNGDEALERYRELQPDVVTMDYQMPGKNGVECTKEILAEFPDAKIILISVFDSEEDIWRAVKAGVKGYLTKRAGDADVMLEAICIVGEGESFYPECIAEKLEHRSQLAELTEREIRVLRLLAAGLSNKEIMDEMDLSLTMVKYHIVRIREKLGALDRTQAVVKAFERGILKVNN